MKPAPFEYLLTESPVQALELKAQHGDEARFLAGGQSLIPAMNFRLAQPAVLIDINPLSLLDRVEVAAAGGAVIIGALTRYRTLERSSDIAEHQPLLSETVPNVAHPQIRNRGTLCGNLAHADPASELPAVMLASHAVMRLQSVRGERRVAARDFFVNLYTTALEPDEMLCAVELPALSPNSGTAFIEVSRRRGDYAMMGVAAMVTLDASGVCIAASLACCNAGPTPMPLDAAGTALKGTRLEPAALAAAAAMAPGEVDPGGNVHASAAFQKHLAGVLTRRALLTAANRARARLGVPA
jgi:carbon-monoxide dehydrogenase medium subunit